jgi:peptide/nickel transport system permease protein
MRYFLRRFGFLVLTLWAAITLNFFIPRMMPGDPAQAMLAKFAAQGTLDPHLLDAVKAMLGLPTEPLWQQYIQYLGNVVTGNFGVSYSFFPYSVMSIIAQALPWTLVLVGLLTVISFVLGTLFGTIAAWRRGGWFDAVAPVVGTFTSAMPYFWVAMALLYFLGFVFHWFPIGGGYSGRIAPQLSWAFIGDAALHSILPALTLLITGVGGWLMGMRNNMINTLGEDFVLLAQAKGLRSMTIAMRYAARNAILPNVTGFAMSLGMVVGGSLLMESVFNYPGMGNLMAIAVGSQDYPLLQTLLLFVTTAVVLANFLADVIYGVLDPRVRREGGVS